jgi:type III secretory pathway component EscS
MMVSSEPVLPSTSISLLVVSLVDLDSTQTQNQKLASLVKLVTYAFKEQLLQDLTPLKKMDRSVILASIV